jgi:hypothetical protein
MRKQKIILVLAALIVLAVAVWLLRKPETDIPQQPKPTPSTAQASNSEVRIAAVSSPANESQSSVVNAQSNSIPADIYARYRQGLISREEAISEAYKRSFDQPQSFYGKVIDQNGQPVAGVEAIGTIEVLSSLNEGLEKQTYKTQSDSAGMFEFTAEKGAPFNVTVKKDGYLMGERGEGYQGPPGENTTPYDRAILTMWKLRGAEPLVGYNIDSKIPYDGTPTTFDITSQKISPDGDLRVTLNRTPLEVLRSGQGFDWTVKIEMLHGGLLAENDPYPYWAPENGYVPTFESNMSSNSVSWYSHLTQNFYIKNASGQYGRLQADVYTALTPARIQFSFTINPSGSQNLEPQ